MVHGESVDYSHGSSNKWLAVDTLHGACKQQVSVVVGMASDTSVAILPVVKEYRAIALYPIGVNYSKVHGDPPYSDHSSVTVAPDGNYCSEDATTSDT
jgi:hypothetical protein